MTLDHLVTKFPDVRFEISNGQKKVARVAVTYKLVGSTNDVLKFLKELEKDWPFSHQRCVDGKVYIEYLVRPEDVEDFIRTVPYRKLKLYKHSRQRNMQLAK